MTNATAIGYVTKLDAGGYNGTLTMMNMRNQINIIPNEDKKKESQPDFRIYSDNQTDIGGAWIRKSKSKGKEYVSLSIAAPQYGPRKIYANLGRAAGQDDKNRMAILWNPIK